MIGPGPLEPVFAASTSTEIDGSASISVTSSSLTDIEDRVAAGPFEYLRPELLEELLPLLARLLAHQVADRRPMLEIGGIADIEQRHAAAIVPRPAAGVMQRDRHLLAVVDDDEEDPFLAPALLEPVRGRR